MQSDQLQCRQCLVKVSSKAWVALSEGSRRAHIQWWTVILLCKAWKPQGPPPTSVWHTQSALQAPWYLTKVPRIDEVPIKIIMQAQQCHHSSYDSGLSGKFYAALSYWTAWRQPGLPRPDCHRAKHPCICRETPAYFVR